MPMIVAIKVYRPFAMPTMFTEARASIPSRPVLRPGESINGSPHRFRPKVHEIDIEKHGFRSTQEFKDHWFVATMIKTGQIEIMEPAISPLVGSKK